MKKSARNLTCLLILLLQTQSRAVSQVATLEQLKAYPAAERAFEKRMQRAVAERDRCRAANRDAHLIVGRVQLEGNDDPETAISQMVIVEEGFFVDVIRDPKLPIGFRCHRYKPKDFIIPEDILPAEDDVTDVGVVQLSRASASNRGKIVGTLKLEDGGDPSQVGVRLSIRNARANTPSNGTEGVGRKYKTIPGKVSKAGVISFESLSEGNYYCSLSLPGYVGTYRMVEVTAMEETEMQPVTMELPRKVTVDFLLAKAGHQSFAECVEKTATFPGGHKWKSDSSTYGWDLEFHQSSGNIAFKYSYAPCYIRDLGRGSLADFLATPLDSAKDSPRNTPLVSGHVYLLNQRHWKHHVLFRVDVGEAIPAGTEMPSGVETRADSLKLKNVIAHYSFDNTADELNGTGAAFELKNTKFDNGSLFLNGVYEHGGQADGFRAVGRTPALDYNSFTVCMRFKAQEFGSGKQTLVSGGTSYRWLRLGRSSQGNVIISFNNGQLSHEFPALQLTPGDWHNLICAVDIQNKMAAVVLDDKPPQSFALPADFKLEIIGSSREATDKCWTFTNYSSGDSFHGFVDELTILNGTMSAAEFRQTMKSIRDSTQK